MTLSAPRLIVKFPRITQAYALPCSKSTEPSLLIEGRDYTSRDSVTSATGSSDCKWGRGPQEAARNLLSAVAVAPNSFPLLAICREWGRPMQMQPAGN